MAVPASIARMSNRARCLALVLTALLGGVAHATRPLEGADSPIGPQRFFQNSRMTWASLSPDGQTVAIAMAPSEKDRVRLVALNLKAMKFTALAGFPEDDVSSFYWVNDQRLVFTLGDRQLPVGKLESASGLFAVNVDGSAMRQLVSTHGEGFFQSGDDVSHVLPWETEFRDTIGDQTGDDVLVVKTDVNHDREYDYLQLQRLDTVHPKIVTIPTPPHSYDWVFDRKGELRVMMTRKDDRAKFMSRDPATNEWTELGEYDRFFDGFSPSYIDENGTLYLEASNGGDKIAVWTYDLARHKMSDKPFLVSDRYDLHPQYLTVQGKLVGLRFDADARVTQWIAPEMKALQAKIDKAMPYTVNELEVASRGDGHFVVIRAFSDRVPSRFFIFDTQQNRLIKLGESQPNVDPTQMAAMEQTHYAARDGLDIPAYLTIPHGAERKNLPLVVLVHGGPWVRGRTLQWDREVQFIAAHGYAVLEPEYRGSTGYGSKLFTAGWKQWGLAMQDDLADGVKWAVSQGIVDPKRVCIAGASYGGYAALMGPIKDPELYRCAIDWVGVTDIGLQFSSDWDQADAWKTYGASKLIGDPEKDAERLHATSPVANTGKFHVPVLMAYGGVDNTVQVAHGERFRDALQKQPDANVQWVVYHAEGHGWRAFETNIDFWNRVAKFLDANIGPGANTAK